MSRNLLSIRNKSTPVALYKLELSKKAGTELKAIIDTYLQDRTRHKRVAGHYLYPLNKSDMSSTMFPIFYLKSSQISTSMRK